MEERELLGGKRFRSIYAWLERANLFKTDLSALIPEIDALLRASYLYLNSMPRRHFSKTMPYQLLNHLFILYLSSAGTMVTPYSCGVERGGGSAGGREEREKEEDQEEDNGGADTGGPGCKAGRSDCKKVQEEIALIGEESCREGAGNS